jgi:large subunit ribosomal protein L21
VYAVINDRSRQFSVRPGDEILCDLGLDEASGSEAAVGATVTFSDVQLISNEGSVQIGSPYIAGAKVLGEVVGHERGDKVIAFRFKRRKNVRRKRGHRQDYVRVKISKIQA